MSLWVTSLNSGSNGNCYYISNGQEAVLIDAGLSCRETEKRMRRLDLKMDRVKAIFISHEHGDHIKGLPVLASRYQLPVYITNGTLLHSRMQLPPHLVVPFYKHQPVAVGGITVTAFPKYHDAAEPHSFLVTGNGIRIGVFTDIGKVCDQLSFYFRQCHAAFLETNYDEDMLQKGRYPWHLKHRISGGNGHLSNRQALELFLSERSAYLSHLFLSHLSADNNDPELALALFQPHRNNTEVVVASRHCEMPVYCITSGNTITLPARAEQLALF